MGPHGPKWGQEDFFLLIQTLPTFWAERILILRIFIFLIFWAPTLGPAWAQLGPSLSPALARAWAQAWALNHDYPSTTPTKIFRSFFDFWIIFLIFMCHFGVRRGFKMILSHKTPSRFNMSSYRGIWTHFRPNFILFWPKKLRLPKIQTFPKIQISSSSHSHKYLTYMGL